MQRPTFPARSCREHVYGPNDQADTCDVILGHPGPCASLKFPASVEYRDKWEARHPGWEKEVGEPDVFVK